MAYNVVKPIAWIEKCALGWVALWYYIVQCSERLPQERDDSVVSSLGRETWERRSNLRDKKVIPHPYPYPWLCLHTSKLVQVKQINLLFLEVHKQNEVNSDTQRWPRDIVLKDLLKGISYGVKKRNTPLTKKYAHWKVGRLVDMLFVR